jgi:hypothetical protein
MTASARDDLVQLLCQMFPTSSDLVAFADSHLDVRASALLFSNRASAYDVAQRVVDELTHRGKLGDLLAALLERSPHLTARIEQIRSALPTGLVARGADDAPYRRGENIGVTDDVIEVSGRGKATGIEVGEVGAEKVIGVTRDQVAKDPSPGFESFPVPVGPSFVSEPEAEAEPAPEPATNGAAPSPGVAEVVTVGAAAAPQFVNLGFAATEAPGTALVDRTLGAGEWYVFWVEIQPRILPDSAEGAEPLAGLREGDILDVIVFGFPRQLRLGRERRGRVQIAAGGNRVVQPAWSETPAALAARRLCFAVRTPWTFGRSALRCNVYHRGVLLQSHLVTAEVTWSARDRQRAVQRACDYNLSASLDTRRLGPGTEHLLSVLINDDGHGTHSFRFVASKAGVPELLHDGHLDGSQLSSAIGYARKALQWVAWGAEEDWDATRHTYRFSTPPDDATMKSVYTTLAIRGANLWGQIITNFGFLGPEARTLRGTMRQPGRVQIALKGSPDAVVPMALIYDYPLDPARQNLAVCEVSLAAIAAGKALAAEPCFLGACPHYDDDRVVCAGGFWGFRHELGLPIHVPDGEVATTIARGPTVRGFAPISTDPALVQRPAHIAALAALAANWLEVIDDRDTCITRLLGEARPLVYFYCHGGFTGLRTPFLEIGERGSDRITAESLINKHLRWSEPTRPLVILNGCHTTATSPEAMFSLLSTLAWQANAAGIIGTEITNFEPIAVQVGTDIVTRFLAGEEIGRAIKLARLGLLRQSNPLGLMYIPFALPTLHLV